MGLQADRPAPKRRKPSGPRWTSGPRASLEEPWLRFGGEDGPAAVDPTVKTENIGDDSLKATELA